MNWIEIPACYDKHPDTRKPTPTLLSLDRVIYVQAYFQFKDRVDGCLIHTVDGDALWTPLSLREYAKAMCSSTNFPSVGAD